MSINISFLRRVFLQVIAWSGVTLALLSQSAHAAGAYNGKRLAAYFEEWSIYGAMFNVADVQSNGDAGKLTDLLYAFANVTVDSTTSPTTASCALADPWADYQNSGLPPVAGIPDTPPLFGNFAELQKLKQLHHGLKLLISLGGASAANTAAFSAAASTPALRSQLASSCINLFVVGNIAPGVTAPYLFDGIDVDWEFPTAADKTNFTALLKEFRRQLTVLGSQTGAHYLLTIAAPAGQQNYSNMQLAQVAAQLDFLNMETYDYNGTWESTTDHAAPLLGNSADPNYPAKLWINATINAYLEAGVPAAKMVLGVPFYGRGWTGVPDINHGLFQASSGAAPSPTGDAFDTPGIATFMSLENLPGGFTSYFDKAAEAQWIYSPTATTFWSFDTQATAALKMQYVESKGLGGGMAYALKDDDAKATLLSAMSAVLAGK